jgi:translocation and assembly module TamA
MRFSLARISCLVGLALCAALAHAADPQPYRVDLASAGNAEMDDALRATSDLLSLRKSAPVSPLGLIARSRSDVDRLKTVLESYGYYQSVVTIKIGGTALTDAHLADTLTALPKGTDARISITFTLGPLYHLRKISIDGDIPDSARVALALGPGAPAEAAAVLAGGARVLSALQERGYAFARVDPPVAYEDRTEPVLDVSFHAVAGARVKIGEIRIVGLKRANEKLVRDRLLVHTGDQFSSTMLERARRDLLSPTLGVFGAVTVKVGTTIDANGGVPITFEIRERLRHAVSLNAAYSSDLGGSGGVTWTDRDVFGGAQQLILSASVINLGGGDAISGGVGYDTSAKFIIPDFLHRDQSLQFTLGAIKQSLQAYDQNAVSTGVSLNRKLSSIWTASVGVTATDESIKQESPTGAMCGTTLCLDSYHYLLYALPMSISLDSTNLASPLDDPLHGMRASLIITPTRSIGPPNATFIITQVKAAAYLDLNALSLTDPGRSVVAVRALAGIAQGAGEFSLPPDQRFYGGGSGTIRGYSYQTVGPQFPVSGNPIGGTAIIAGSVEFRQRFGKNFGAAVFVDGGQVSASLKPLPDVFRIGVGAGIRYYTGIGPIRVDVAVPTRSNGLDSEAFEVYIGLGQAF